MAAWRSIRRGSFFSTASPFLAKAREKVAALALRWRRRRGLHRLFASLDRGRIAREVADQAVLIAVLDQRLVEAARQGAARKLREGAREGRLAGKLSRMFPAAQPAQLLVNRQPLDQHRGHRQPEHRLGDKGPRQRRPVAWRPARQPTPALHEGFDPGQLQRRHHLLVHFGERPEFFRQPGEKIALNVRPGS